MSGPDYDKAVDILNGVGAPLPNRIADALEAERRLIVDAAVIIALGHLTPPGGQTIIMPIGEFCGTARQFISEDIEALACGADPQEGEPK